MTGLYTLALGLGLFLLFLGDVFSPGTLGSPLLWAGRLVFVTALGLRIAAVSKLQSEGAKQVGRWILFAYGGATLALVLCFAASEAGRGLLGLTPDGTAVSTLRLLWPALLLGSLLPLGFMEAVYGFMPVEESVDVRRIRSAAFGGLTIAFALIFVVSLNITSRERDVREDVSYFRVTVPSEGTVQTVAALDEKLTITLLFPKGNEVLARIKSYFQTLDDASKNLALEIRDHALVPELTRKHNIPDNGYVVLASGDDPEKARVQKLNIGTELVQARATLKTLDGRFRRLLTQLTTIPRELYLTAGHDERSAQGLEGESRGERIAFMDAVLRQNNISVRTLGMAQGLAQQVPEKAPAVAVVGPKKPFLPEEVESLITYLKGGGRVAVFVDPAVDHGLDDLLSALGLKLESGVLNSERYFRPRTGTKADRTLVYTDRYSAHPTVTLAMRNAARGGIASIFIEGGALSEAATAPGRIQGTRSVFPITTRAEYWLDLNGNHEREQEEWSRQFNLMAAVTIPNQGGGNEGRAVVVADGDFFTDQVIQNPGNGLVLSDILQWLIGPQQIVGDISSEEDVKLERTSEEDKLIFWGFGLVIPLLIAAPGAWFSISRRRRGRHVQSDSGSSTKSLATSETGENGTEDNAPAAAEKQDRKHSGSVRTDPEDDEGDESEEAKETAS